VRLRQLSFFTIAPCMWLVLMGDGALAHHVMGGKLPATFVEGVLSGVGHPIIGLDHLAAVVAVGLLAAAFRLGPALVIGYVLAQIAGAAVHVHGTTVPGAEVLVAASVLVFGAATIGRQAIPSSVVLGLFVLAGFLHGYVLAESIVGAEPSPLAAYFVGLFVIQTAVALGAMVMARRLAAGGNPEPVRLAGAMIVGVGLSILAQQLVGNA
jgi:urease accessory protein